MNSRRDFIRTTSLAGAGIVLAPSLSFSMKPFQQEKLKLGFIGVGLRGTNHLNNAILRKDTEITAICDLDPNRIDIALKMLKDDGRKNRLLLARTKRITSIYWPQMKWMQ